MDMPPHAMVGHTSSMSDGGVATTDNNELWRLQAGGNSHARHRGSLSQLSSSTRMLLSNDTGKGHLCLHWLQETRCMAPVGG